MKINKPQPIVNHYQKVQPVAKVEKSKAIANEDNVEISTTAKELLENRTNTEKQDKIKALKQQIDNGTYVVNEKQIAENLYKKWFK